MSQRIAKVGPTDSVMVGSSTTRRASATVASNRRKPSPSPDCSDTAKAVGRDWLALRSNSGRANWRSTSFTRREMAVWVTPSSFAAAAKLPRRKAASTARNPRRLGNHISSNPNQLLA